MRRMLVAVLAAALTTAGTVVPASAQVPCVDAHEASDHTVISSDGTNIAITAFRPIGARAPGDPCGGPVPVVLTLHGWSGSRQRSVDQVSGFLDRGYGVVAIDARGHGASGGLALVHHPTREVRDFQVVMDRIADNLEWVQREGPRGRKDIKVGAAGGSYGGGFQLMTAAFDDRLDALVPQITWNNLPRSLAPNGVSKTDWLALLYAAGKLSVDVDPRIDEWFLYTMATNRPNDANVASFTESSPSAWMPNIDVPTLLIQGVPDTVFPLNEAVDNYIGIRTNGAPAWLVAHNSGHILPAIQPTGLPGAPGRSGNPCATGDLTWDFYAAFLKDEPDALARMSAVPGVQVATEQGGCVRTADWPVNSSSRTFDLGALVVPSAGSQLIPLFTADASTTVAGIPTLNAAAPLEVDDIFFASLVLQTAAGGLHVVDDQVVGARTQLLSVEGSYNLEMHGVATTMQPGDTLYLRLDGQNEQYALNGNRRPGVAIFPNASVTIPIA